MANLNAVNINKGSLGPNRVADKDAISAILFSAGMATAGLNLDEFSVIYNLNDAEQLGITAESDATNQVIMHRHIAEFYAMAGEGTKLYLVISDALIDVAVSNVATDLLNFANGEIKQLAVANSRATPAFTEATISVVDGLDAKIKTAISSGQFVAGEAYNNNMPVHIFLEGYNYTGPSNSVLDLRDITDLAATKVSLVIGQDYDFAEDLTGVNQKFADVGTALGVCAKAKVNENIGDNSQFNLTEKIKGRWLQPGLSSHKKLNEVYDDLQTLEDKGYIFGMTYFGLAGVRFNNDHVCAPIVFDADNNVNEHTIAYSRTADKAVRQLRRAYLPRVKTSWEVDSKTGKLSKGTIVSLQDIGDQVFDDMIQRGEISFGQVKVNPDSDLLVDKVLEVAYTIVPKGNINEITGTLNLKTKA